MGRELLLDDRRHKAIVEFIKGGSTITNACRAVGISQEAYFTWMRHGRNGREPYVAFFEDVQRAKALARYSLERVIIEAAPDDWRAAAWMLERQHPEEYAQRSEVRTIHELPPPADLQGLGAETLEARIRDMDAKKLNGGADEN